MAGATPKSVLHGKFSSWLPWHQPFLADLLAGLDASYRNVVLCNRVENADRFPRPDLVELKSRALLQPQAAVVCAAELRRRFAPSLLHGHFGWSGARLLLLKAVLRIPLVTTFGGRDAGVQLGAKRSAPVYRILLDACDRIVCVSHHLKGELLAAGADPDRVSVIHRGTDLDRFPVADRAGRPVAPLRILMVGRLVEKKAHGDALAAVARLRQSGRAAELTIVGAGPAQAAIEADARRRGIAPHVTVHAPMDQRALGEQLAAADVFLHCSVTAGDGDVEGIPNVVVEAAATGLAIVGTRHGGIVEVVEEGKHGLLVPEREPEAIAAALARLAAEPGRRLEMGRAAAVRARAAFDLRAQIAAHRALYDELMAEAKPRPVALPDDFFALARRAIGGGARAWDHTLARAAEEILAPFPSEAALAAAPRGYLDRALEAPTGWPRPWRSAAELSLDLASRAPLPLLAAFRKRTKQRAEALDRAVLARLREEPELAPSPREAAFGRSLHDLRGEPPATGWRRLRERIAGSGNADPGDDA